MAREVMVSMKDFNLGNNLGQINNKEDRRVYIEKANAKASLEIKAAKKAKKLAPNNREVEEFAAKVREAIRNDAIPMEVTLGIFNKRIKVMEERRDKMLRLKDRQKGFLAKSDVRKLEQWVEAIKQIESERDDFIAQSKLKNQEKFDVTTKKATRSDSND